MNKIWEFIKNIWRAIKGIVIEPAADYGADFYCKLGDLLAEKCKDNKDAKEKAAPIIDKFMEANRQLLVRAMDGDFSSEDRAVVKAGVKQVLVDIGNL